MSQYFPALNMLRRMCPLNMFGKSNIATGKLGKKNSALIKVRWSYSNKIVILYLLNIFYQKNNPQKSYSYPRCSN